MTEFVRIEITEVTNTCFVVMPFEAIYDPHYTKVIRPAIEDAGLECIRGDEIYERATIVDDIWNAVRRARLVVAELSGRNPNVMYEVGLAHALGKPTVLLTRREDDVPFDLRALRYVYYDVNNPSWGMDLRTQLTQMIGKIMENPGERGHLAGIASDAKLPETPERPAAKLESAYQEFSGVWSSSWQSVVRKRLHEAHLVVPKHDQEVTAYMTVRFQRDEQLSIVHELMRGEADEKRLQLAGVSYTYIERGASRRYHLDRLRLCYGETRDQLDGIASLRHGDVEVRFTRVPQQ